MSAATSLSPVFGQLTGGEHLSVHTSVDSVYHHQSLASAESIDEVQLSLNAQADEQSMDEDRTQGIHFDMDPSITFQVATESHASSESFHESVQPEQVLEALDEAYKQAIASGAASIIEESMRPSAIADVSVSNQIYTPVPEPELNHPASANIATDLDFIPLQDHRDVESHEVDDIEFTPSFDERDISTVAQDLGCEAEAEVETNPSEQQSVEAEIEHNLNYTGPPAGESLQPVATPSLPATSESHEANGPLGARPPQRMDDETVSVAAHNKNIIINIVDEAPTTVADENAQSSTFEEQDSREDESVTPAAVVITQPEAQKIPQQDAVPAGCAKERTPASIMAHLEHIQIFEPEREIENAMDGEDATMEVNHSIQGVGSGAGGEVSIDQFTPATEEPAPTTEDKPATPVEHNFPASEDPAPVSGDSIQAEVPPTITQVTTTVEQTTTTIDLAEHPESGIQPMFELAPEVTLTNTTTNASAITISTDSISAEQADADEMMKAEHVQRAERIQQEQHASAEIQMNEGLNVSVAGNLTVADVTNGPGVAPIPDEAAPKDNGDPLHIPLEPEPGTTEQNPSIESVEPIDPAVTKSKGAVPTEISQSLESQYHRPTGAPSTAPSGLSDQPSPEWEGFAALDEDAPGSPDPSSEVSEHPDLPINHSVANPDNASTANMPGESSAVDDPPKPLSPLRRTRKQKMIMEVVIPTIGKKSTRGQPRSKPKATTSPPSSVPTTPKSNSRSPQRRSMSMSSATPSANKPGSASRQPTSAPRKRTLGRRTRPFGSRKRMPKKLGKKNVPAVHVARSVKVEVVMPRKPRPSALRRVGSLSSGNNVKFASTSPVTGKRKAESEPEETEQTEDDDLDADAEGEIEEGYEDVEEVKVEQPKPRRERPVASPKKRPRRSLEARKAPTRLPEEVGGGSRRPAPKRRRMHG